MCQCAQLCIVWIDKLGGVKGVCAAYGVKSGKKNKKCALFRSEAADRDVGECGRRSAGVLSKAMKSKVIFYFGFDRLTDIFCFSTGMMQISAGGNERAVGLH